jgi:tRNA threonylcarbamoyladenosine biosynthesis protein TsaE
VEKEIVINSEKEMINLGYQIGKKLEKNMVIALIGDLGTGKTTFTKGIGQALEIKSTINSPTFTILKIYQGKMPLYHMDVYRINEDSGDDYLEEYFDGGGVTVVEWAENIAYLLPKKYLKIEIKNLGDDKRLVQLKSNSLIFKEIFESVNI